MILKAAIIAATTLITPATDMGKTVNTPSPDAISQSFDDRANPKPLIRLSQLNQSEQPRNQWAYHSEFDFPQDEIIGNLNQDILDLLDSMVEIEKEYQVDPDKKGPFENMRNNFITQMDKFTEDLKENDKNLSSDDDKIAKEAYKNRVCIYQKINDYLDTTGFNILNTLNENVKTLIIPDEKTQKEIDEFLKIHEENLDIIQSQTKDIDTLNRDIAEDLEIKLNSCGFGVSDHRKTQSLGLG